MITRVSAGGCEDINSCPTVLVKGRTAFVQGFLVTDPEVLAAVSLAHHEGIVAIPVDMLLEAADSTRQLEIAS